VGIFRRFAPPVPLGAKTFQTPLTRLISLEILRAKGLTSLSHSGGIGCKELKKKRVSVGKAAAGYEGASELLLPTREGMTPQPLKNDIAL